MISVKGKSNKIYFKAKSLKNLEVKRIFHFDERLNSPERLTVCMHLITWPQNV